MALVIELCEKRLHINNSSVYFNYNIQSIIVLNEKIIVLLDIPMGCKEIDNIYAVDMNANIIWRIQSMKERFPENRFFTPYVGVSYNDDQIVANDFNGGRYVISSIDGKIIGTMNTGRLW